MTRVITLNMVLYNAEMIPNSTSMGLYTEYSFTALSVSVVAPPGDTLRLCRIRGRLVAVGA